LPVGRLFSNVNLGFEVGKKRNSKPKFSTRKFCEFPT